MITNRQNWQNIFTMLKANSKTKLTEFLSPAEVTTMWNELPIIFASIKAIKDNGKYSATKTLQEIPEFLVTPKGKFDKKNLSWLIATVGTFSRSILGVRSQTKTPSVSALVPIFLSAQRAYNKINYNEWNRQDERLEILLGKSLAEILKYEDFNPTEEDILVARSSINVIEALKRKTNIGDESFKAYSSVASIVLQAWAANAQYRTEDMILDLKDWDTVPTALDISVVRVAGKAQISDMPW